MVMPGAGQSPSSHQSKDTGNEMQHAHLNVHAANEVLDGDLDGDLEGDLYSDSSVTAAERYAFGDPLSMRGRSTIDSSSGKEPVYDASSILPSREFARGVRM